MRRKFRRLVSKSQQLSACIDSLYAAAVESCLWPAAVHQVRLVLEGSAALLFSPVNNRRASELWIGESLAARDLDSYQAHFHKVDLWLQGITQRNVRADEVFVGDRLISREKFQRTEFFCDFLRHLDISQLSTSQLSLPNQLFPTTFLSVYRSIGAPSFDSTDLRLHQELMPHLRRALNIRARLELANTRANALAESLNTVRFGIVLLDVCGIVVELNDAARELVRTNPSLRVNHDGSLWIREPTGSELGRWLANSKPETFSSEEVLHIPRPPSRPLSVTVIPLLRNVTWVGGEPRWMLLIFDPDIRMRASVPIISRDLNLSHREAEFAASLFAGYGLTETAKRLGVSVNTARTHLKSIFSKTETRSQVDLFRRIASGPGGALQTPVTASDRSLTVTDNGKTCA